MQIRHQLFLKHLTSRMVVLHAVGPEPGGGALRATLQVTQTPRLVHRAAHASSYAASPLPLNLLGQDSIILLTLNELSMPRMLMKQSALCCARGTRPQHVAAPPPPLRAEMGGSTSSEKRDLDGVACLSVLARWQPFQNAQLHRVSMLWPRPSISGWPHLARVATLRVISIREHPPFRLCITFQMHTCTVMYF